MMRPLHLARRFFESLRSRPLTPGEQQRVSGLLRPLEARLFWRQMPVDQRHALGAADAVAAAHPGRGDLVRAALLHDVGKSHSRLGIVGRVTASLLSGMRIRPSGRLGGYLDHGALGAADLAEVGADSLTVAFAAGHHGPCPDGMEGADWAALRRADGE